MDQPEDREERGRNWRKIVGEGMERYGPCERMRRRRGWTQVRLAGLANVGIDVVKAIEGGRVAAMDVASLLKLSVAMGCTVVDLVPGFAQRHYVGEGLVAGRSAGFARPRDEVAAGMVELLRSEGGRMKAGDVIRVLAGKYGVSAQTVLRARRVAGVKPEQVAGRGMWGMGHWDWVLPPMSEG